MGRNLLDPFLSPATLAMNLWPSGTDAWVPAPHLTYASAKITHALMKGNARLIISMPPQHGKSRLITETTIPWFLERFPKRNMMLVAYNQDFAEEWGARVKDIISGRPDLFSYKIRDDRSRVDRFETTHGGICWFSGIKSGQTGKGAFLIVIDDYLKGIEQAMSKPERESIWRSFVANIDSRTRNGTNIIIVATRWWSTDLIGMLLKHFPQEWEYICFPAMATPETCNVVGRDVLGRAPGEALFPELHDIESLMRKKRLSNVAGVIFDALYQQKPIDDQTEFASGKWLKVVTGMSPHLHTMCRAWDMASKQGGGDWTTGTKMGRIGLTRHAYVFGIMRKQISPRAIEQLIRRTAVADGTDCTVLLEVEPGSQGMALFEHYRRNVLPEFEVIAAPAGNKSKVLKAQPMLAAAESGNVFCVDDPGSMEESAWITELRQEMDEFPPSDGGHDDQIDTMAICFNHLFQHEIVNVAWGQASEDEHSGDLREDLDSVFGDGGPGSQLVTGATW